MTNKLYDVNYFIVVLDYYKELVAGGGIKKLFFLEGVHLLVLTFPMFYFAPWAKD